VVITHQSADRISLLPELLGKHTAMPVREVLIFFALYNGSGAPLSWTANHRLHHATADTPADISSPQIGGFW
jgi:fatty-acid desaturase